MLFTLSTDKTVTEAATALQAAVQANHFGVMQVHNLTETMAKKGLEQNMAVSTALPCRISIYEEGGKTVLATLKPTALLGIFNLPELEQVAQEVEQTILKIMSEAAR